MRKCVLTIAGSDPSGGAGIQNDLKTIAAHGLHGASCTTVITIQNSKGLVRPSIFLDPAVVGDQILAVGEDIPVSSIKVGLLGNDGIAEAVSHALEEIETRTIVLDPVIWAGTGDELLEGDPLKVLGPLLRKTTVITPNVAEAEALSGMTIRDPEDSEKAARRILEMGPKSVVVKGGHLKRRACTDVLLTPDLCRSIKGKRIASEATHGSGCTFSTSIACGLARGLRIEDSVVSAKRFTERALEEGRRTGAGNGPVDPLGDMHRKAESLQICESISRAVGRLEDTPWFSALIPQVGTNIAMAPSDVRGTDQVIGLTGRIVRVGCRARASGCPMRGGSSHMARMAFTLRQLTKNLGCCMNIKYDQIILDAGRNLGLSVAEFEREHEPEGEKTMSWGLTRAIKSSGQVPDLVYDLGSPGKEPMIRILGTNPEDVAEKAIRIAGAAR